MRLFMVIEQFKDREAIGERFRRHGRMLPEGITYEGSWLDPSQDRCWQLMGAKDEEALQPWIDRWSDLMQLEVVPVLTSAEYWES